MERGMSSFQRGDFEQAAVSWTEAARRFEAEQNSNRRSQALIQLAQAYRSLGQYRDALKNLESALALAEASGDRAQTALAMGTIGDVYIATGPAEAAQKYLQEALRRAKEINNDGLVAIVLNNGNLSSSQKKYAEALSFYKESASSRSSARTHR
jgi:tetratricopeptide (TPR) repeat protein